MSKAIEKYVELVEAPLIAMMLAAAGEQEIPCDEVKACFAEAIVDLVLKLDTVPTLTGHLKQMVVEALNSKAAERRTQEIKEDLAEIEKIPLNTLRRDFNRRHRRYDAMLARRLRRAN